MRHRYFAGLRITAATDKGYVSNSIHCRDEILHPTNIESNRCDVIQRKGSTKSPYISDCNIPNTAQLMGGAYKLRITIRVSKDWKTVAID